MDAVTGTPKEVQVKVIFKERDTEAWVKLEPAIAVDPAMVKRALQEQGVVVGIDEGAVLQAAYYPSEEPTKVAQGIPPQHGADAKITYYFRMGAASAGKPLELEDGRVDYRELGNIENVTKGQVLATKTPPGMGIPGKNVRGEEIPAKNGKEVHLRAGQNAVLSEDEMHVTSLIDGQPKVDGKRISVQPIIVISSDVDFSTGNINFQGSVKIGGNVLPGFTVKATQDVEIGGVCEGASIEAGGKVTVKGGVRQHTVITAHGDVSVRFVDSESSVTTRANLMVVESALHSTLTAGLAIKVGKKLIGGTAQAGEYISAEQLGTPGGTVTVLDVRTGRQAKVIEQLEKAIATLNAQLATVDQTYKAIVANPNAPSGAFEKTREIKSQLETRLDQLQAELAERTAVPENPNKHPFVAAKDGFQPGVQIHFDTLFHHIDTQMPVQRIAEVEGRLSIL
ncbi:MAG: DUF342 domain-containing protein [Candidatus Sericytochromatia bacterium]